MSAGARAIAWARAPRFGYRPREWHFLAAIVVALVALPALFNSEYLLTVMTIAGIWALLSVGLTVLVGGSGEMSLAHGSLYGVGAYAFAILSARAHVHYLTGMLAAAGLSAGLALLVGLPLLRTRGLSFAIVTLGFAIIASDVFENWTSVTHGVLGIGDIPYPDLHWLPVLGSEDFTNGIRIYYLVWAAVVLVALLALRAMRSDFGLVLRGIGGDERLVESLGFRGGHYRLVAFVFTGAAAGLAGSLYGQFIGFISPGSFTFWTAFSAIIMVTIGGRERVVGALVAAVALTALPEFLRVAANYRLVIYAVVLFLVLLVQHRRWLRWPR